MTQLGDERVADGIDHRDENSAPARIEILKRELAVSRAMMVRARDGLEASRAAGAHLRAELNRVRDELSALAANAVQLGDMLRDLRGLADSLSTQNAERGEALRAAQGHIAGLEAHIQGLETQIAAIHRSASWRLTRPLRAAGRAARRLLRILRRLSPSGLMERARQGRRYAAVKRSGLFDPAWYIDNHADLGGTAIDPLNHYLTIGWREGRRPGPGFDPDYYRYANPDLAKAGIDPLAHYVMYGVNEGRDKRSVGEWRRPAPGFGARRETVPILPPAEVEFLVSPRIAVAVHAFYPEVFGELCPRLAEIPGHFTLLVSTPTPEAKQAVEAAIAGHGLQVSADVRVTPNRGRNFGPLLSEFSKVILQHDLLLHIHTKKSLHNATGEQAGWRDDIFDGLIGRGGGAASVIALFADRPEVGVLFTRTFRHMAYWANHWLQNVGQGRALFARLGVSDYSTRGYIDYPVGGMFWARVQAIAPLFETGFNYTDFPEEAGQLDGTIAHAIERSFVDVARARGYTFAEADPDENLFRLGWSDKNLDRYELNTLPRLKSAIEKSDLVSFDLFDTVMQRPSISPDAVQRYAGLLLAREMADAPDFFTARKAAEHAARAARNFEGDVGLDAIYQGMGDAGWGAEALARARVLEVEVERRIVLTRPPVVEALRHAKAAGKRVIAVSDTYFGRADIDALLAAAGLDGLFDDIVLSNELGARKDRGDLWKALLAREGAAPGAWLHIGDNEVSDMQRAGDLGLMTTHVMNPATLLLQKGFLQSPTVQAADEAHGMADALLLGPAAARLAADPYPPGGALGPSRVTTAHDLGYCAYGPALFAFSAWLAAQPDVQALDRLYFLSREGWALQPIYDRVRVALSGTPLPPSHYLHASRRTVLLAAQAGGLDPGAVIDGPEFDGDMAGLLKARLGFDIPDGAGVDGAQRVRLPADAKAVRAALDALRAPIEAQAAIESKGLSLYLAQLGLSPDAALGVVDVGYRGTIQKGLQAALGRGLHGFYLATFPAVDAVAAPRSDSAPGSAAAYFGDRVDPLSDLPIVRYAILLEAFLTAPEGQLDHFRLNDDGAAEPVFQPTSRGDGDLAVLADLHAGALAYAEDLIGFYGPAIASLSFTPAVALEPLIAFAAGRLTAPGEVLHALRVDDAFCGFDEHEVGLGLANA